MKDLQIERDKLEQTLEIIKEVLNVEKVDLEKLYKDFIGSREELWSIADRKKIHIKKKQGNRVENYK